MICKMTLGFFVLFIKFLKQLFGAPVYKNIVRLEAVQLRRWVEYLQVYLVIISFIYLKVQLSFIAIRLYSVIQQLGSIIRKKRDFYFFKSRKILFQVSF